MRHSRRAWVFRIALCLTCLLLLGLIASRYTGHWVAFEGAWLNSILLILMGLSVPVTAWLLLDGLRINWLRVPIRGLLVLGAPLYALIFVGPAIRFHSWEVVAEVEVEGSRYRAYRRPFYLYDLAIALRRERPLILGLQLRSGPRSASNSDRSDLEVQEDGGVVAKVYHYPDGKVWTYAFPR